MHSFSSCRSHYKCTVFLLEACMGMEISLRPTILTDFISIPIQFYFRLHLSLQNFRGIINFHLCVSWDSRNLHPGANQVAIAICSLWIHCLCALYVLELRVGFMLGVTGGRPHFFQILLEANYTFLMTEAQDCEWIAQACYTAVFKPGIAECGWSWDFVAAGWGDVHCLVVMTFIPLILLEEKPL